MNRVSPTTPPPHHPTPPQTRTGSSARRYPRFPLPPRRRLEQHRRLAAMPTPGGVPVKIRSPGSSVTHCDRYQSRCGTPKMNSFVFEFCIVVPLRRSWTWSLCGSVISSAVTSTGPVGAKVSNVLPIDPLLLLAAELPVAGTHVVAAHVAADVVERGLVVWDVPAGLADHDDQLGLVIDLLSDLRNHTHRPRRPDQDAEGGPEGRLRGRAGRRDRQARQAHPERQDARSSTSAATPAGTT